MRVFVPLAFAGIAFAAAHSPAQPERGEAEKLFRQMEARLGKARAIECNFEVTLQACPGVRARGSLLLGEGNKHRIEVRDIYLKGPGPTFLSVSDGKKMSEGHASPQNVPKWQNEALKTGFSRAGFLLMRHVPLVEEGKDFRADEAFRVMDVHLGKNGAAGPKGSQLIRYTLVTNGADVRQGKTRFAVSLWIDPRAKLPLKRVVVPMEKDMEFTLTETYSSLRLDGKVDPKQFDLPKE